MSAGDTAGRSVRVTRVEFSLTSPEYPFVGISVEDGGRMVLEENVVRRDGLCTEYFSVDGVCPDRLVEAASGRDEIDARTLTSNGSGGLVEVTASGGCPIQFLAERGALPTDAYSAEGEGRIVADIPESEDVGAIVGEFLDSHPDATLVSKKPDTAVDSFLSADTGRACAPDTLTPRQREVILAAQEAGYYDWPRETNGRELAAELDVSPPTLHKHLRTAERKLVAEFVERRCRTFDRDA